MLKVKKTGFYTSIQDLGRYHFRHYGVPVSGAMDQGALKRANALLENDPEAAGMEITMQGPVLEFQNPTFMVLSGSPVEAKLDGVSIELDRVYKVPPGAQLICGPVLHGFRTYLAVKDGFRTEKYLGSRSYFTPVTPLKVILREMELPYESCEDFSPRILKLTTPGGHHKKELQVTAGPEFNILSEHQKTQLLDGEFQVAKEYDRMACQLEQPIDGHRFSMITSATLPGTIQLTPSGKILILMRDGQTTGGYPRILQLHDESIDLMGQKKYGDSVRIQLF